MTTAERRITVSPHAARLTLRAVTVQYGDTRPLDGVSMEFGSQSVAVMGPSGSGKSSLLRVLAGRQLPTSGQALLGDRPVEAVAWRSSGDHRLSLIHQDYRLVEFLNVHENLELAAEVRGVTLTTNACSTALARVSLPDAMRTRFPGSLSGGEQQRVAIARALVCEPSVILADEPTGALDRSNSDMVATMLAEIATDGVATVIIATHDSAVAARFEVLLRLADGQLERVR